MASAKGTLDDALRHCFPAGTLVGTISGLEPIETITAGAKVWAYDLLASDWCPRIVLKTFSTHYQGRTVLVTIAGETVESTFRHPFWVLRGEGLDDRPRLGHLATVPSGAMTPGRWVDAGDLQVGDELLLRSGRSARIETVTHCLYDDKVYNFSVQDLECYGVGQNGLLVHNTNGIDAGPPSAPKGGAPNNANNAASAAQYRRGLAAEEAAQNPTRSLNDPLPPHPNAPTQANPYAPDPAATGPHTVVGTRTEPSQSPAPYRQGITYDADGYPMGRTDVTTHGRGDHPNPHYHPFDPTIKNPFAPMRPGNFGPQGPMPPL